MREPAGKVVVVRWWSVVVVRWWIFVMLLSWGASVGGGRHGCSP